MRKGAVAVVGFGAVVIGAACSVTGSGINISGWDGGAPAGAPAISGPTAPWNGAGPDASVAPTASPPPDAAAPVTPPPDAASIPPPAPRPPPSPADAAAAPPSPPDAAPPPPPDAAPAAPAQPLRVLRVHDVMADQVRAGVVYAHKLQAKGGVVSASADPLPDDALASAIGSEDVKGGEVVVDVLYAHDIRAMTVDIKEAHIVMMKVGDK
jgi:hypothetical protein